MLNTQKFEGYCKLIHVIMKYTAFNLLCNIFEKLPVAQSIFLTNIDLSQVKDRWSPEKRMPRSCIGKPCSLQVA